MFIFLDRERTKNIPKYIKACFYTRILPPKRENFVVLKIKGCTPVVVGFCYDLLPLVANFELWIL